MGIERDQSWVDNVEFECTLCKQISTFQADSDADEKDLLTDVRDRSGNGYGSLDLKRCLFFNQRLLIKQRQAESSVVFESTFLLGRFRYTQLTIFRPNSTLRLGRASFLIESHAERGSLSKLHLPSIGKALYTAPGQD
jgi:hypothetical protein